MSSRRVVVTGLGVLTASGTGWRPFWEDASSGRSSIRRIQAFSVDGFPAPFAGEINGFNPGAFIRQRKSLKLMSRDIQLAVAAAGLVFEDAGGEMTALDKERFGVILGADVINNDLDEIGAGIRAGMEGENFSMRKFGSEGLGALFPLWFLKYLPNMPACHVSLAHGLKGPSNTIVSSAASAARAVGEAFRIIQRGDADAMLAGGTDSKINPMGLSRFELMGLLSRRNVPEKGYRPFDESQDGIVPGEGAGILLLEEYEQAKKRGARIYAEAAGFGSAAGSVSDPHQPQDVHACRLSIKRALDEAGLKADELSFVVTNGSGIPEQDRAESAAYSDLFGRFDEEKMLTLKPVAGHLGCAAAAVEAAGGLAALSGRKLPAEAGKPAFLLHAMGFAGEQASLVFKECP